MASNKLNSIYPLFLLIVRLVLAAVFSLPRCQKYRIRRHLAWLF